MVAITGSSGGFVQVTVGHRCGYELVSHGKGISGFGHAELDEQIIQKTPGVVGGDACIRNTRISVWLMVELRDRLGMNDGEIMSYFDPPLTDADLSAAWGYYDSNKNEIDEAIRRNED